MTDNGVEPRPRSLKEALTRVWLEALNMIAEYGALVVFAGGAAALELARRSWNLPTPANVGVIVSEAAAALTMVAPKSIRALGDVLQVLAITMHDVWHAIRYGKRR
jgi:hypothetical protein